jgi:two-component sensor histidine kinase
VRSLALALHSGQARRVGIRLTSEAGGVGRAVETAVELDLPVDQTSVREARDAVERIDELVATSLRDAQLIVCELVSNALTHAGLGPSDLIALTVACHGSRLRIDVDDGGAFTADSETFLYPRRDRVNDGHGLRLVQTLALRWQALDGRVSVWLDISSCAATAATATALE